MDASCLPARRLARAVGTDYLPSMVRPSLSLADVEALVVEFETARARGDITDVAERLGELEDAIVFLMGLNLRLAGNDQANALVASLQLRARRLRERIKRSAES